MDRLAERCNDYIDKLLGAFIGAIYVAFRGALGGGGLWRIPTLPNLTRKLSDPASLYKQKLHNKLFNLIAESP